MTEDTCFLRTTVLSCLFCFAVLFLAPVFIHAWLWWEDRCADFFTAGDKETEETVAESGVDYSVLIPPRPVSARPQEGGVE